MKQMLEISTAILLSVGGAGAIVLALSCWLGKIWANRILESDKKRYQLEIEEHKDAYTNRPNRIKELQELLEHQIREYLHGLREIR